MRKKNKVPLYQNWELFITEGKMTFKMHQILICFTLIVYGGVVFYKALATFSSSGMLSQILQLIKIQGLFLFLWHWAGGSYPGIWLLIKLLMSHYLLTMSFVLLLYPALFVAFRMYKGVGTSEEHVRGQRIIEAKGSPRENMKIWIGGLQVPKETERRNFLIMGSPGTGKTQIFLRAMKPMQHSRNIVIDAKNDYLTRYMREGDKIFNPLDSRSVRLDFNRLVRTPLDADSIAASMIPESAGTRDRYFIIAAQDILYSVLMLGYKTGDLRTQNIWNLLCTPDGQLAEMFSQYPECRRGYAQLMKSDTPRSDSVTAVLRIYVRAFSLMKDEGEVFDIDEFMRSKNPCNVFVTVPPEGKETLKPILSLFVDLMARKALQLLPEQDEDNGQRLFFMLDELSNLQCLPQLTTLLKTGRSKGISIWIGTQSVNDLIRIYGNDDFESIVNCTGSFAILRSQGKTAEYVSQHIFGTREVLKKRESISMSPNDDRDGISLIDDLREEKIILPSEISLLKDLESYVRFPGDHIHKTRIKPISIKRVHPFFMLRPEFILEEIQQAEAEIRGITEKLEPQKDEALKEPEIEIRRNIDVIDDAVLEEVNL